MFCNKCGAHVKADAKFCAQCGDEVKAVTSSPDKVVEGTSTNEPDSANKTNIGKKKWGCLQYILCAVGIFVVLIIFGSMQSNPQFEMEQACHNAMIDKFVVSPDLWIEFDHKEKPTFTSNTDGTAVLILHANLNIRKNSESNSHIGTYLYQGLNAERFGWQYWTCQARYGDDKKYIVTSLRHN
jgi:RNA polymerase subunit RPABC4/transcription elongation factor Spt4